MSATLVRQHKCRLFFLATEPSPLDEVLDELKALVDKYLPVLGPILGLKQEQTDAITTNFDKFVADAEALEHGTVDISTGLEGIVTDMLEIFKAFGLDYMNPTDDTPTDMDALLAQLEAGLGAALDILGPILGLTENQIKAAEDDIDSLIKDFEDVEHGHLDVDGGMEKILTDILNILKDLGAPVSLNEMGQTTTPKSIIDTILDELKDLVDRYLPIIGPLAGLTREQTKAIKENFDKFVVDVEGMEHGTVEIADGVIDICIDILHVLEAVRCGRHHSEHGRHDYAGRSALLA
ncbi:uncharacterized protein LOC119100230 [Pollicipes pollicipes]|uniref:uncharacterized protein LOC119100230 n=1 Tax=Pollicipes pollicipes TaxID=41117 RepID=UPI001884A6D2|nr:uncharacterized protein LOC119100230 [Pollicipes pollicipes]